MANEETEPKKCRCGCGKIVPLTRRGNARQFFNDAHRAAYHQRIRQKALADAISMLHVCEDDLERVGDEVQRARACMRAIRSKVRVAIQGPSKRRKAR